MAGVRTAATAVTLLPRITQAAWLLEGRTGAGKLVRERWAGDHVSTPLMLPSLTSRGALCVLMFLILAAPATALACPSCAASARETSTAEIVWVSLLTASPLLVGIALAWVLRRFSRPEGPP